MTEREARDGEREARVRRRGVGDRRRGAIGDGTIAGARSVPPTPHLTSPLKGGRDELGKGGGGCWVSGG